MWKMVCQYRHGATMLLRSVVANTRSSQQTFFVQKQEEITRWVLGNFRQQILMVVDELEAFSMQSSSQ